MSWKKNADEYVERYCREHKLTREQALSHAIVKEVIEYYKTAEKDKISVTEAIECECFDAEDKSC